MSDDKNKGLLLEMANDNHIPLLLLIQKTFHTYTVSEKGKYTFKYEVANDPFSENDFRNIVSRNECVILIDGDVPAGYMLIDCCSQTKGLKDITQSIEELIKDDLLDEETKLFPRFAEVLHPSLYKEHFKEVRWQMLLYLADLNKEKYKGLCYAFFTNADTLMEKINSGWKIAFDNGLYYYVIWEINLPDNAQ